MSKSHEIMNFERRANGLSGWWGSRDIRKSHYYLHGLSLCGRWARYQTRLEPRTPDAGDLCAICMSRLPTPTTSQGEQRPHEGSMQSEVNTTGVLTAGVPCTVGQSQLLPGDTLELRRGGQ